MNKTTLLSTPILFLAAGLPVAVAEAPAPEAPAPVRALSVDGTHSSIVFAILHLQTGYVYGRFNRFSGTVEYDADDPKNSSIDLRIEAESVDTGIGKRDDHLRSQDFFSVKEFPEIRFQSKSVEVKDADTLEVTGEMSMHGKKKTVTAEVDVVRTGDSPRGWRAGFRGRIVLKRSDFGMTFMLDNQALGDEVEIVVSLQAVPPRGDR